VIGARAQRGQGKGRFAAKAPSEWKQGKQRCAAQLKKRASAPQGKEESL
jgi:hypothetical protein